MTTPVEIVHGKAKRVLETCNGLTHETREVLRLYRVLEIEKATRPTPSRWRRRAPTLGLVVISMLVIAILQTCRLSATEIELDLISTDVSFVTTEQRRITRGVTVEKLTVRGHASPIEGSAIRRLPPELAAPGGASFAIRRTTSASSEIALDEIHGASGTATAISYDEPPRIDLALNQPAQVELAVTITGSVAVGEPSESVEVGQETLRLRGRELVVQLTGSSPELFAPLAIRELGFRRVTNAGDTGSYIRDDRSGIVDGSLILAEIGGREVKLRSGTVVDLGCAEGVLRRVAATPQGLQVRFHGSVCRIDVGHGGFRDNLLPTRLEWIRARASTVALWTSLLWLLVLLGTILKWWRAE